ncbi:MAG: lipopolysaccharide transport system permease protein [Pseudomonadales bacterium]|jgi:lipopolysaccharide transport system permease protein
MKARYLDLILYRSLSELRTEASRGYLGVIWWFLEPILYMGVFYLVFGLGFRQGEEGYVPFLLCGLIVWKWIDSSVRTSAGTIAMSVGLMGQVYLPKIILPTIVVFTNTIKFFIILSIFVLFLLFSGYRWGYELFALPIVLIVQFSMVYAAAGLAAGLVPFIPDLRFVVNYGMTLLFFMSGIFFDIGSMSEDVQQILVWNPVVMLIECYRDILLNNSYPPLNVLAGLFVFSVVLNVLVYLFFRKFDRVFPRVIG